jgi:mevalonate kinase
VWFEGKIDPQSGIVNGGTDEAVAKKLTEVFQYILAIYPDFLQRTKVNTLTTQLEFDRHWGLGSSSTLVYLLSQWVDINPYAMQYRIFGGSGYDIACAEADGPIFFEKWLNVKKLAVEKADYAPTFSDQLYFVYLGQKQNSRSGIQHYREVAKDNPDTIKRRVSRLTSRFCYAETVVALNNVIEELEAYMSTILQLPTAKSIHFPDYWGAVKSLGAWGGDFVMVTSDREEKATRQYFSDKGKTVFIPFDELILQRPST